MKLNIGNPFGIIDSLISPAELNLGFQTGFILEFRHVRGKPLPATLVNVGNSPKAPSGGGMFIFKMNPEQYTISENFAHNLTPVQSHDVIAEEDGILRRNITLEGTFGIHGKGRETNLTSVINSFANIGRQNASKLPGVQTFIGLRDFFRAYSDIKKDPEVAEDIQMIFHVLRDDDHFLVVPKTFTTPRDQRSRIHYRYRIEMEAIAVVESKLPPVNDSIGVGDIQRMVAEGFHDARAAFAEATALTGVMKRKVANINSVMIQAAGLINSVGNLVNGFEDLITTPKEQFQNGLESINRAADQLAERSNPGGSAGLGSAALDTDVAIGGRKLNWLARGLNQVLLQPEKFGQPLGRLEAQAFAGERLSTSGDVKRREAGADIGTRTRVLLGSGSLAGLDFSGFNTTLEATIQPGDTLETISDRYVSSKEALILVNELRYPYITPDGGPGLRRPGDSILVPTQTGGSVSGLPPSSDYLSSDTAVYGVDLKLDDLLLEEGVLDIAANTAKDDGALSRGVKNLVQGLSIITHTEAGSTKFIPELGIRRTAGTKGTLQDMLAASVSLRESILSDPRIAEIIEATIVLDGDALKQEITPRVRGRAEGVTLVLPYGSTSGV